jgi:hypothetical protein
METWSHSPVKDFKTTFFVDTNILCYLIDETYPMLNKFIKYLKDSPIVELISSEYVLLEFTGIRKREHYLREALSQTQKLGKSVNLSSLLKYHNQFSLPEIDFHSLLPNIKTNVDAEKDRISSEFGITFKSGFHKNLFNPTSDICLSTKISKEDSLVLVSSILPSEGNINRNVIFLTNDADFHDWFYEKEVNPNIDAIFQQHDIPKPDLQHLKKIKGNNGQVHNLTENVDLKDIIESINTYLKNNLSQRLNKLFVGISFKSRDNGIPNDCMCLEATSNNFILNNKHITIIGKDIDFVYNSECKVSFWNNGQAISNEGFTPTEGNNYLSFKLQIDDAIQDKSAILAKLRDAGHLIFIHPDN